MKISAIQLKTGDLLPKWYYGYSYQLESTLIYIFYPIPFNFIIRWIIFIKSFYNRFRCKPNYLDNIINNRTKELNNIIKELRNENFKLIKEVKKVLLEIAYIRSTLK
ncbi:MAG: hypothetical protein ACFFDN_05195 [Candidatus Hodarchaeota archaeon]